MTFKARNPLYADLLTAENASRDDLHLLTVGG
jgi:hypothetical protein